MDRIPSYVCIYDTPSPLGPLFIAVDGSGRLLRCAENPEPIPGYQVIPDWERCAHITTRLQAYFAGDWESSPLDAEIHHAAGTPFQQAVWDCMKTIPAGSTLTYAQVAEAIGHPNASRAVGSAAAANPCLLFTPCHRVVAAGYHSGVQGSGGYRAGGIESKVFLLELERRCMRRD